MSWDFVLINVDGKSADFHNAFKNFKTMSVDDLNGSIEHDSPAKSQLRRTSGAKTNDRFYEGRVVLTGSVGDAHEHRIVIERTEALDGYRLYAGKIEHIRRVRGHDHDANEEHSHAGNEGHAESDAIKPTVPFLHNGTWHGVGRS